MPLHNTTFLYYISFIFTHNSHTNFVSNFITFLKFIFSADKSNYNFSQIQFNGNDFYHGHKPRKLTLKHRKLV